MPFLSDYPLKNPVDPTRTSTKLSPSILLPNEKLVGVDSVHSEYEETAAVLPTYRGPCLTFNARGHEDTFRDSEYSVAFRAVSKCSENRNFI